MKKIYTIPEIKLKPLRMGHLLDGSIEKNIPFSNPESSEEPSIWADPEKEVM